MKSAEFVDFQWTDYEGLPMEDRFRIVETHFTKGKNLFESNSQNAINKFNSLHRKSVFNPVPNKKYIMALLALMNDEVMVSQDTQIVEYISKHDNYYVVKLQDGREAEFPHKAIRDKLLMSIFLFDNIENYNLFRVDVIMMFDRGLPEFKEEDLMEDYQQIIPPTRQRGRWSVTFIPKDKPDSKPLHRDFESYDDAAVAIDELERSGYSVVGIPIEISEQTSNLPKWKTLRRGELRGSYTDKQLQDLGFRKNPTTGQWYILRTKWEELVKNNQISEAIHPRNTDVSGKTETVYFLVQKAPDGGWKRIAKYRSNDEAENALEDLRSGYEDAGHEPPQLDIEMVHNYPQTTYEGTHQNRVQETAKSKTDYSRNPVGLRNWNELKRAVEYRSSDPTDSGHTANLRFGDQVIQLPKSGDMARLYKWVKNNLGNNKQREVFELLASPKLINHLVISSKPPKGMREGVSEGKTKRSRKGIKNSRKTSKTPRVYGGWWGWGGDPGYSSGDGGDGGAMEESKDLRDPQDPKDVKGSRDKEPKVELPPAHHSQKTQIPGTLPTYQKAYAMLNDWAPQGTTLDFGAGLGVGARYMGSDTFEPFPRPGFQPTYRDSSAIGDGSYNRITNLNVLNVVPKDTRDSIVSEIGRILAPGGVAIFTTRGRDVLGAKGERGPEPMSIITSIGTYQKGFTKAELKGYIQGILGRGFEVENINLGPAGVAIRKLAAPLKKRK